MVYMAFGLTGHLWRRDARRSSRWGRNQVRTWRNSSTPPTTTLIIDRAIQNTQIASLLTGNVSWILLNGGSCIVCPS